MVKDFLNECFIRAYFYLYESRFPRAMLYCPIIKVDFAALSASTRFSPRTSIWDELTDEKFNNNFVILYTKLMLQITGYINQTTYLSMVPNPTMFSPDHTTRIKFLLFIFTWFIWFISLALIIIIMEVSILAVIRTSVFNIRQIKVFIFFGVMTFVLSICFNVLQSLQKSSIEHPEQVRSLRTILRPSKLGECKAMMTYILQYYFGFANLFRNHPAFSTMKKSNFLVDCLDSFWMTASMSSILQTACWLQHTIDSILSEQLLPSWDSK